MSCTVIITHLKIATVIIINEWNLVQKSYMQNLIHKQGEKRFKKKKL